MKQFVGLTTDQAQKLLQEFGANEIREVNKLSIPNILFRQVRKNFVIYLLAFAAVLSFLVGKDVTGYTVLAVIILVTGLGFIQEYRAEQAINSLKNMIMPISLVLRDGKEVEVTSSTIVPGDIVVLRSGEKVPADCLILEQSDLRVNESTLTGESKEITKQIATDDLERDDQYMVFMGTFIVNGKCYAKVINTGMETKFGKIAGMISSAEKELPLQIKVNNIAKYMVIIGLTVAVMTGLLMFARTDVVTSEVITGILIMVIALSVSSFPEAFPVVLITTLANGAASMAKKNAIVNRMSIIETLGETTIICSDKTGTITMGEMTAQTIYTGEQIYKVTGAGYEGIGNFMNEKGEQIDLASNVDLTKLLQTAVLCNDSKIERTGEDMIFRVIGTPTEGALKVLAAKASLFAEDLKFERKEEQPFNSERKMMSVLVAEGSEAYVYAKGAPEVLLQKCKKIFINGKIIPLTEDTKLQILQMNQQFNISALRTLAFAFKPTDKIYKGYSEDELVFIGLVGMEDPPRVEVKEAINLCKDAGIKIKMITGDNKETAISIGKQVGLLGEVLEGAEIDKMLDEELSAKLKDVVIFARVRPEHKLRIVKLLKAQGEIVTMTGDGVNDAPALKEAHIGVAMGKNGTDVSRSVADLTLKDDNFATIVEAIREGRTIFNNIRKFVSYQLSCNIAELTLIFVGVIVSPFLGWEVPFFLALQILFMNMVTDDLPAITLGLNSSSLDIMKDKPRKQANILNKPLIVLMMFNGLLMTIIVFGVYYISFNILGHSTEIARTEGLVTLIMLEIASAFNFRSFRFGTLNRSPFTNHYLVYASVISLLATLAIIYTGLSSVFDTAPLSLFGWISAIIAAFVVIIIFDILKYISNKKDILLATIN